MNSAGHQAQSRSDETSRVAYESSRIYTAVIPLLSDEEVDWKLNWDWQRSEILIQLEKQKEISDDEMAVVVSWFGDANCDVHFDPSTKTVSLKTKGNFKVYHNGASWELESDTFPAS